MRKNNLGGFYLIVRCAKLFCLVCLTFLIFSCKKKKEENSPVEFYRTEAESFSIEIPDYLTETSALFKDAALQYADTAKEVYIIAVSESKEGLEKATPADSLLKKYFETASLGFISAIKEGKIIGAKRQTINTLPSYTAEITGKVNGHKAHYQFAAIESPTHFYQVVTWTTAENKDLYATDMEKMIYSFRENE